MNEEFERKFSDQSVQHDAIAMRVGSEQVLHVLSNLRPSVVVADLQLQFAVVSDDVGHHFSHYHMKIGVSKKQSCKPTKLAIAIT